MDNASEPATCREHADSLAYSRECSHSESMVRRSGPELGLHAPSFSLAPGSAALLYPP